MSLRIKRRTCQIAILHMWTCTSPCDKQSRRRMLCGASSSAHRVCRNFPQRIQNFCQCLDVYQFYDRMTVHRNRFLVNKTNRCTEIQFYWCYDSTCFWQPFCPSSGVLSRTSALVHFMQFWWPYATRSILLVLRLYMFRAAFLPIIRRS